MTASTTPPVSLPEKIRHYIGGEFVDSIDGEEFDVLNPVTNEAYIKASSGKKADIEAAVAAAKSSRAVAICRALSRTRSQRRRDSSAAAWLISVTPKGMTALSRPSMTCG